MYSVLVVVVVVVGQSEQLEQASHVHMSSQVIVPFATLVAHHALQASPRLVLALTEPLCRRHCFPEAFWRGLAQSSLVYGDDETTRTGLR